MDLEEQLSIGEVIAEARKKKGISRNRLAKESKVSPQYLQLIESGQNDNLSRSIVIKLCSELDIPVVSFFPELIGEQMDAYIEAHKYIEKMNLNAEEVERAMKIYEEMFRTRQGSTNNDTGN